MVNYSVCDYGDCKKELPIKEMVYLRLGDGITVRRFCSTEHLDKWLHEHTNILY